MGFEIKTRSDFDRYIKDFNTQNIELYSQWYGDEVCMIIPGKKLDVVGKGPVTGFFVEGRKHVNEHIYPNHVVLDEGGLAAHVTIYFVPKHDWPASEEFPAAKLGQAINAQYIVFYLLDETKRIGKFWAVEAGTKSVVDAWDEIRYTPNN
ncbi:hypothetical protein SAPIO_CDS9275 [Scedosporium apiospermum]|uniref:SnoaL-like domain-containing protein n=1 Tax=Pseudallescheria apiosperma TaxID=563466 RepID=A0A084FYQ5_PSEDA|nr:uncharacterized protein SAPIO_CDS9275 [Scedosporium apiospermum]KEZ40217.1 hypothetical protein SAPIO_CDS9275 [Scedosporium apiospermum]